MMRGSAGLLIMMMAMVFGSPVYGAEETDDHANLRDQFQYEDHNKRDPMWSLVSPNGTILQFEQEYLLSDLSLEGIIESPVPGDSIAIINGQILKETDAIGSFRVQSINEKEVVVTKGDRTFKLYLE
jgi:hypothetical protein